MYDKKVSVGCAFAYGLWAVAGILLAASWVVDSTHLGNTGLAFSAAAATAHVRQFFVTQNRCLRNAFELGRDSAHVSPMSRSRVTVR